VDLVSYADLAARLVNSAAPDGGGRDGLASVEAYRALVADRPHLSGRMTPADLDALRLLRGELRLIFTAAAAGRESEVAERLNALLVRYPVHPHLVRHDGQPWHVHLADSGSAADRHATGAVAGLTAVVSGWGAGRIRCCAASGCQRVFIDHGPVRGRPYCSPACGSGANIRAMRVRHGARRAASTAAG
jgi:predicted RNA-binding Zn ribbon-like protein